MAPLDDPRAVQILTAEHGSLLSARSLAYNEAFVRAGNFLAFLSMSFVALALVAQVLPGSGEMLLVAALVMAFDLVVGLTTYGRIVVASYEDYRAEDRPLSWVDRQAPPAHWQARFCVRDPSVQSAGG